jgi:hypothetical protein
LRERVAKALPSKLDEDVPGLAVEVAALVGNRASHLGMTVSQMGNRAGLLAIGCPTAALAAIATATIDGGIPSQPAGRLRWIVRSADARDLVIFAASEAYIRARRQLELLT